MKRSIYTQDHEQFRGAVREYIRRHVLPTVESHAENKLIPRAVWREAGIQGILGLEIPESYNGGQAEDYRFNAVVMEELAAVNMALAASFGIHFDIVAPYIVDLASDAQKSKWLPRMAAGEVVAAIAMTEPSGGSDLARLKTTAVRDGSDWVLNGSKTFITNGYTADVVVVAARTDPDKGARGISLFLVDATLSGFERGRKLDKVGQPEADTAELFFDGVRLPADTMLGEPGTGFVSMMERLPQERLGGAATNLAHAKQILLETIEYAKSRTAFGSPIGGFQHNKFLLAELVTKVDVAQAYVDACVVEHSSTGLSAVDAAKVKWWCADLQNNVLDHCVQLFGGYGYMREYRVARAWMDARVTKIWAGSNEIMKEIIGRDLGL
ncbi:acyl-CoA dehydrogenase [Rhodococcus sp. 06-156-3C]|uniref:acyl-CoA dehydrogenase family protein n=1 Tax=Nocardiaceae TaxID=85025 RepID=UPI00052309BE|nr:MULTISPECIES: acyl-CoA dehydrogenase family protein [Rhodococcus]OZD18262.1 acyl-CoA dehydrogenase [Rhodococcus sp. 06-156-4C]OZD18860.1 acyl-CoA dehydrogenase [Rhodococcus sp. 06-156-3C]OZD22370.1 acyl-CoA dehydrogenase [Rhodococcus sp. 06-156-4a]OZD33954.1 acyl-CoA dehydrogenase [Rhodococcus sp. 06-156-3b]OZD38691.1 acyl-CoA dehydrogenase [Rhodococcus sp. 06-156-3]